MINFLKYTKVYFLLSAVVILIGLFSIVRFGYRLSIDFAGGSSIEYSINPAIDKDKLQSLAKKMNIEVATIDAANSRYVIRTKPIDEKKQLELQKAIEKENKTKVKLLRFDTVGPTLGRETMIKTIIASIIASIGILIYLTFAFKNLTYGIAAVLAMIHDLLVVAGLYSLLSHFFGAEVDTLFVTALLTTMSFSVHDTIVVFDKIREYRRRDFKTPLTILANKALTETMVRSLNNSLTIILMLTSLTLLGGEVIRFFIVALLIGTITGTYSSPFVAVPILELLEKRRK